MKVGQRVGAVLSGNSEVVNFLGYGVYLGDYIPEEAAGFMGEICRKNGVTNPKIELDSGLVVYGCECWWGPEENIRQKIEYWKNNGAEIIEIDIDEYRQKHMQ